MLAFIPAKSDTSVLAAETEGVGENNIELCWTCLVDNDVEVAVGIRCLVVDGRWDAAMVKG